MEQQKLLANAEAFAAIPDPVKRVRIDEDSTLNSANNNIVHRALSPSGVEEQPR